ncbi:hypothetical protein J2Y69_001728 [Microbacterium resistens]|uniref:Polyketide cyclase / dehydrase and lipid transport n=1 Tax=Microbacterium resistens TaxID=156977 RepID=A0ABU1SBX9_9MICO|nr:protealysin inhibitor emfourin [Microbacterium resistens]MDR6867129.1 hypothetical protein [Microbacterium resistens]
MHDPTPPDDDRGENVNGGPTPGPEPGPAPASAIVIIVTRSGGIAGIRREWRVEPPQDGTERWAALVDLCPWDAPAPTDREADRGAEHDTDRGVERDTDHGADRFVWRIDVRMPTRRCEREVPETQLNGPWRTLVDAVRDAAGR